MEYNINKDKDKQGDCQKIESESLVKGFKKYCISNDLHGTEDDILWETVSVNENTDDTNVTSMSSHSENSSDSE